MFPSAVTLAVKQFLTTTTLHGLKYLSVPHKYDRVGWVACLAGSVVGAAFLSVALWARFIQAPVMMSLQPGLRVGAELRVALCLAPTTMAAYVTDNLQSDEDVGKLTRALAKVVEGRHLPEAKLRLVELFLQQNRATLAEAIAQHTPPCRSLFQQCWVDAASVPCKDLIGWKVTTFGACCVAQPKETNLQFRMFKAQAMHLILSSPDHNGFQFYARHHGEKYAKSYTLLPGFKYEAPVQVWSLQDEAAESVLAELCVSRKEYSRPDCVAACVERMCRCCDPRRVLDELNARCEFPLCDLRAAPCLRDRRNETSSCDCPPACKVVTTYVPLISMPLDAKQHAIDPMYDGLDSNTSIILKIKIKKHIGNRVFVRVPTETWFTLLSSLGGVFNMFLGVGLFTALEFVYFLAIRLSVALRTSFQINPTTTL